MESTLDKQLVKQQFRKSFQTYDDNATAQKIIIQHLVQQLKVVNPNCERVLEIGCGTGLFTRKMLKNFAIETFFVNDLVEECCTSIQKIDSKIIPLAGDAENLQIPDNLSLIVSTSTVQWFKDLSLFLEKLKSKLNPNGFLAFTTFGERNMYQINEIENTTLNYLKFNELKSILTMNYDLIYAQEKEIVLHFDSPLDVIRHLKMTGVNGIKSTTWTRKRLQNFESQYKAKFFDSKGYYLTYQPLFFIVSPKKIPTFKQKKLNQINYEPIIRKNN